MDFTLVVSKKKKKSKNNTTNVPSYDKDAVTYYNDQKGTTEYDDYINYMLAIQCYDCQYAVHCQRHRCK